MCCKGRVVTAAVLHVEDEGKIEDLRLQRGVFLIRTEHQQNVYEDVVLNDYSLSEVAQDQGISRQGVHDLVKRSTRILEEYEEKLHLVEKFVAVREKVHEIHGLTQHYEEKDLNQVMNRIETLSHSILEEL